MTNLGTEAVPVFLTTRSQMDDIVVLCIHGLFCDPAKVSPHFGETFVDGIVHIAGHGKSKVSCNQASLDWDSLTVALEESLLKVKHTLDCRIIIAADSLGVSLAFKLAKRNPEVIAGFVAIRLPVCGRARTRGMAPAMAKAASRAAGDWEAYVTRSKAKLPNVGEQVELLGQDLTVSLLLASAASNLRDEEVTDCPVPWVYVVHPLLPDDRMHTAAAVIWFIGRKEPLATIEPRFSREEVLPFFV